MSLIPIGLLPAGPVPARASGSGSVAGIIGPATVGPSTSCIVDFGGEEAVIVVDALVETWTAAPLAELAIVPD